jgi:hypothetical protein
MLFYQCSLKKTSSSPPSPPFSPLSLPPLSVSWVSQVRGPQLFGIMLTLISHVQPHCTPSHLSHLYECISHHPRSSPRHALFRPVSLAGACVVAIAVINILVNSSLVDRFRLLPLPQTLENNMFGDGKAFEDHLIASHCISVHLGASRWLKKPGLG